MKLAPASFYEETCFCTAWIFLHHSVVVTLKLIFVSKLAARTSVLCHVMSGVVDDTPSFSVELTCRTSARVITIYQSASCGNTFISSFFLVLSTDVVCIWIYQIAVSVNFLNHCHFIISMESFKFWSPIWVHTFSYHRSIIKVSSFKISKPLMSSVPPARNQWHRWLTQRHRSAGDNALLHPSIVIVIVQCTITMCTHPLWLPSAPAHPTIALDPSCAHLVEQWLWNHFCHLGFVRDPLSRLGHRNPGRRCNLPQFGAGQCAPACTWHCCDIIISLLFGLGFDNVGQLLV